MCLPTEALSAADDFETAERLLPFSGCNTALESAVSLASSVQASSASSSGGSLSREDISTAFRRYSEVRMPEAKEVQRKSALAARAMTNSALSEMERNREA